MKKVSIALAAFIAVTAASVQAQPAGWPANFQFALTTKDCPATVVNKPVTGKCLIWDDKQTDATKKLTVRWPDDDGCPKGASVAQKLKVGTEIDRFGSEFGKFFGAKGETFASRAVPYVCKEQEYRVYKVVKEFDVQYCRALPWFAAAGGAKQYGTVQNAKELVAAKMIEPVGAMVKGGPLCQ